ncbi:MAG: acetylglutamate kinase [Dehalococcoidia bacterium]|nr:acetylglutamate kinase [Dehalococcoidia bacterium]
MSQAILEPPIVVKIGGSTLGGNDTSLQDLVALHAAGKPIVIVHGGGNVISEWMQRQNLAPNFVNGLRVTDAPSLDIVVAVLGGLVNKELTAQMQRLGAPTIGISGMDGCLLQARVANPDLGYVGEVTAVDPAPVNAIVSAGFIPMVSPIAVDVTVASDHAGQPLNVNGDTAAGALAHALKAERIIFLTDVAGVMDNGGRVIPRLDARGAEALRSSGVARGGMLPKLAACLDALADRAVPSAHIIDGRETGALMDCVAGKPIGTRITA